MKRYPFEKIIFTVGTSHRTAEEFFGLLAQHQIGCLADVRRFPTSSRFPHFSRGVLEMLASQRGVQYHYLGELLGGFRRGGYDLYRQSGDFRAGLERLKELASGCRTAFFCAERFPWRCHRRFVAAALEDDGWQVVHIIEGSRTWMKKRGAEERHEASAGGQIELGLSDRAVGKTRPL